MGSSLRALLVRGWMFGCALSVWGPSGLKVWLRGSGHAYVRWSALVGPLMGGGTSVLVSGEPEFAVRAFCARGIVEGSETTLGFYVYSGGLVKGCVYLTELNYRHTARYIVMD